MKYSKVTDVIMSCATIEQVHTAERYAQLYCKEYYPDNKDMLDVFSQLCECVAVRLSKKERRITWDKELK